MLLWAGCFPLITIGLDLAPHVAFAAMRAAIAGLSLILLAILLRRPLPRDFHTWILITTVGFGSTTLGFLGMFHAAEYVTPGIATVITNTQPLLTALLAHGILQERLSLSGKAGLVVGLLGVFVIAWPAVASGDMPNYRLGIAYVALAVTGVALGNIGIKRLTGRADGLIAMGFQLSIGAIPLALLSTTTEDLASFSWSLEFAAILLTLAVLGTSVAFWLWFRALEQVGLTKANAFTFLVPIIGLAIGTSLFGERLTWTQAGGAILILGGILLVQRASHSAPHG
ncbi:MULTISPECIES: DMT family transporter [Novosphingobium]|uniref:DMT family transporter n=2 Tax=Novosphingobium TaxID=165696 RepID=UPI0003157507